MIQGWRSRSPLCLPSLPHPGRTANAGAQFVYALARDLGCSHNNMAHSANHSFPFTAAEVLRLRSPAVRALRVHPSVRRGQASTKKRLVGGESTATLASSVAGTHGTAMQALACALSRTPLPNWSFNMDAPHIAPRARNAPRVRARVTHRAAARQLTLR